MRNYLLTVTVALIGAASANSSLADDKSAAGAAPSLRVYVMDCGEISAKDQGRWSPGVNEGKPIELSDNCYLIRHGRNLLLWDTGIPDQVVGMPDGMVSGGGAITYHKAKTLAAELAEIKVRPSDITCVAISHSHGDHIGNLGLFPAATVLIQRVEYDFAFADPAKSPLPAAQKVTKLDGDYDVFGDGSVMILSTPGHTPGHESLLLMLRKTGPVVLSGDAVHLKDNWENRRVPGPNFNKEQTIASMARIQNVMTDLNAQLWINHDKPQSVSLPHAPRYFD